MAKTKEGRKSKRRKRTIITPAQLEKLEGLYKLQHWPSKVHKDQLAQELDTTGHFVSIWFQNKRARVKKEQEMAARLPKVTPIKKKPKPSQPAPKRSKMKLTLKMSLKSPPSSRSHAHCSPSHAHSKRSMLLPRPKSPWSSKFRPSNLSRSAYGLPFSFFPDIEVGASASGSGACSQGYANISDNSNDNGNQPKENYQNLISQIKSEPEEQQVSDWSRSPPNVACKAKGEPKEPIRDEDTPAMYHQEPTTWSFNTTKTSAISPQLNTPVSTSFSQALGLIQKDNHFDRNPVSQKTHVVANLETFLGGVDSLNLEPDIMRCVQNFVSPKKLATGIKQEQTEGRPSTQAPTQTVRVPSGYPGDNPRRETRNSTSSVTASGPVNHSAMPSSLDQSPTLFRCIVCMMALVEGDIVAPGHPDFSSATNDALYGIRVNKQERLTDNATLGLDLVRMQS